MGDVFLGGLATIAPVGDMFREEMHMGDVFLGGTAAVAPVGDAFLEPRPQNKSRIKLPPTYTESGEAAAKAASRPASRATARAANTESAEPYIYICAEREGDREGDATLSSQLVMNPCM